DEGRVCVGDMGLVSFYNSTMTGGSVYSGNPNYLPPELLHTGATPIKYANTNWDVWAVGLIACEMLQIDVDTSKDGTYMKTIEGQLDKRWMTPLKVFINGTLDPNYKTRTDLLSSLVFLEKSLIRSV